MPTNIRRTWLCAGVAVLALSIGGLVAAQPEKSFIQNDLQILVLAYHLHNTDTRGKAPARAEDLAPFFENDKRLLEVMKSGQILFQYNVRLADIPKTPGPAKTILAYERDATTKGGYAAFVDGSVKKLTAEEFKKTTLAGMK